MIYSRSPYYVDIDATLIPNAPQRYEMRLYIWKGNITAVPTTPTYLFNNNLYNDKGMVNISNYINDFLTDEDLVNQNTTGVYGFDGVVNVRWEIDIITSTSTITNHSFGDDIAMKGYAKYDEGRNYSPTIGNIMTDARNLKVYDKIITPTNASGGTIIAISYPSETILLNTNIPLLPNSGNIIHQVQIQDFIPDDKYITITVRNSSSITYQIEKECKHKPINVQFKNRYGVMELLCFFKKNTESINVTSLDFNKKSYVRQINNYNTNATKDLVLTSGYQPENFNTVVEQLLLSEEIYIEKDNKWIPYNIKSNKLSYKTKLNDKLISYEITFEQAFNLINNV